MPSIVLVLACLLVGIFPEQTVGRILAIAAGSVLGELPVYELKLWHGLTVPLLMSFVALGGGIAFYAWLHSSAQEHDAPRRCCRESTPAASLTWSM